MSRQKTVLRKLLRAAQIMIQGGLSETTRRQPELRLSSRSGSSPGSYSSGTITVRTLSLLNHQIIMKRPRPSQTTAILHRYAQRFEELKRQLQQVEYFCKGTVLKRMMKCGKAQCGLWTNF